MFWIIAGLVFVAFFFATCVCCGCQPIITDDFDRADSGSIGSDWTVEAGAFEIASNRLFCETSNSIAIHDTVITATKYAIDFRVTSVANPSPSAAVPFRIYLWDDSSNYIFFERNATTNHCRVFENVAGGGETLIAQIPHQLASALRLYVDNDNGAISLTSDSTGDTLPTQPAPGTDEQSLVIRRSSPGQQIGLGVGTLGGATAAGFDSIVVYEWSESCGYYYPCCEGEYYPPEEIQVEISGAGGTTDCVDGFGTPTGETCAALDGTYTLQLQGTPFGGFCTWIYFFSGTCGSDFIIAHQRLESGTMKQWVYVVKYTTSAPTNVYPLSSWGTRSKYYCGDDLSICAADTPVADECAIASNGGPTSSGSELCRTSGYSATATITAL